MTTGRASRLHPDALHMDNKFCCWQDCKAEALYSMLFGVWLLTLCPDHLHESRELVARAEKRVIR